MIQEFVNAAAPWVIMGLVIALVLSMMCRKEELEEAKKEKSEKVK